MHKKKMIIIPLSGLGNRMRVLASCIELAKEENRIVYIVWPINSDLGCDIKDIFENIGIEYLSLSKWKSFLLSTIYKQGYIKKFFNIYKIFSKLFFDESIFDDDIVYSKFLNKTKILNTNAEHNTLLIATCFAFKHSTYFEDYNEYMRNQFNKEIFKLFVFNKKIIDKVNEEYLKIGESYIGIHVRRTDHVDTIKHSPDQNYFLEIERIILNNANQKFFLATDSIETKKIFKEKYRDNIFIIDTKLERNSIEGMYGGITELLLLSRSSAVICSIISSFSNAAINVGSIEKVKFIDSFI